MKTIKAILITNKGIILSEAFVGLCHILVFVQKGGINKDLAFRFEICSTY